MGEFSVWHLLIVALVFLALFGHRTLPDAARSLGRSLRILRSEMDGRRGQPGAGPDLSPPSTPLSARTLRTDGLPDPATSHPSTVPPQQEPVTGGIA